MTGFDVNVAGFGGCVEFDINLILVPITLVFLLVWLWDKLVLKQHRFARHNAKQVSLAQNYFDKSQKALAKGLKNHGITHIKDVEHYIPNANTPSDLLALHGEYQNARRQLAENKAKFGHHQEYVIVRWAYEFLPVLVFLVVVRAFVVEPFNIPSSSMVPSLYTGDFIVVNKSAYGLRLPITHSKILDTGSPKHGDVVVFRYPLNEKRYYIKRVIGLPGDTVAFADGKLSINGKPVKTVATPFAMPKDLLAKLYPSLINNIHITKAEQLALGKEEESFAHYYTESLGEHVYKVRYLAKLNNARYAPFLKEQSTSLLTKSNGAAWQISVPQGQYFVMGDNRDRSEDGRFWGFVSERHLAGKATYIWMHKEPGLAMPSFGRAGKID